MCIYASSEKINRWHWTEQVKGELIDSQISLSFEQIKKKSKESLKSMVKNRAKEFILKFLKSKHKQASHSKMEKANVQRFKDSKLFFER